MKKKYTIIGSVVVGVLVAFVAAVLLLTKKVPDATDPILSAPVAFNPDKVTLDFASDLKAAFARAVDKTNLPETSISMADAYVGNDTRNNKTDYSTNLDTQKQFYIASVIKPLYVSAIIDILKITDINYKVPFKFVDADKTFHKISEELSEYISYKYQTDSLLVDKIVPILEEAGVSTKEDIYTELTTNPKIVGYEFTLEDILKYTLGPSSNWGLSILRNHFSLKQSLDEESGANAVETYLNNYLKKNNFTGNLIVNLSTKSISQKTFNTDNFFEIEYLFQAFFENKFNLNTKVFELMKVSMEDVSSDAQKENRRHEIKSMAKNVFGDNVAVILEKSGYIGLDFEAAPGLNTLNGWDKLTAQDGKRIVFFDASAFSRIYLKNGFFIHFNYSIAAPFYISLDPAYEELNDDYLVNKDSINDALQTEIKPVLTKYKEYIKFLN
ncbi:MAG: hypothetical protein ABIM99_02630 [Candidatus Dojkabacteria bacterium]